MSCSNNDGIKDIEPVEVDESSNIDNSPIEDIVVEEVIVDDKVIHIKDLELEKLIREEINKPDGELLMSDMALIEDIYIDFTENPVYEIEGLEYAINLEIFCFSNGTLKSLNPISQSKKLYFLDISYAEVEDQIEIFDIPVLENVGFIDVNVSDYSFLMNSNEITNLIISGCNIENIDFIVNMDKLKVLILDYNRISDIKSLEGKQFLEWLNLHVNEITEIEALSTCESLVNLNLSYNNLTNIESLFNLENLEELLIYEELDYRLISRESIKKMQDKGVDVSYTE
jgi:internalin A